MENENKNFKELTKEIDEICERFDSLDINQLKCSDRKKKKIQNKIKAAYIKGILSGLVDATNIKDNESLIKYLTSMLQHLKKI